jgi:hypothetical protein
MAFEFRITATFAPDDMMRFGPLIKGRVALPTSKDPKDGIEGFFLIDTGASNCFIDQSVASDLGITSLGPVTSHGLGGAVEVQRHKVMIFIPAKPLKGNLPPQALAMLGFVQEVGTVDINTHHEGLENIPGRVLGALGRNILRFTRSVYDGTTGTITIETDEAMRQPRPAVTSYNDAVKRLLSIAVEQGFKHPLFIRLHSSNGVKQAYRQNSPTVAPTRLSGDDVPLTKPIELLISDREELRAGDRLISAKVTDTTVEHETLMYDPNRKLN